MSASLKTLRIEHLRGAVLPFTLPFEQHKRLTVIYGENATGKSTICDAFEFLGKGKVGSLENRGLGRPNKYWNSVGKSSASVSVTLETRDGVKCFANIVKSEVIATPASAKPKVEVLRRSQILALVEASPSEKYTAISRFIDVSGIETSEATLRSLIRDLTSSREVAVARIQENQDSISQFWASAGGAGSDAISWAIVESKRDAVSTAAEISSLRSLQQSFANLTNLQTQYKQSSEALEAAGAAHQVAKRNLDDTIRESTSEAAEIVNVLKSARAYLAVHQAPDTCPLCESSEKVEALDSRVALRLESLSKLTAAQADTAAATANLLRTEQNISDISARLIAYATEYTNASTEISLPIGITFPEGPVPTEPRQLGVWLAGAEQYAKVWRDVEVERLEGQKFLIALKSALLTYSQNMVAQKELDALLPRLARALELVAEERRAFTDTVLATIADEVGRIYEVVHPGEGLNKISLALDPAKRSSLEIGADFCGEQGAPPQAYFSESHLDSLGLCVFLALAGLEAPGDTILVLDDVLASVDEPHVERLIEMLYTEASKFKHCVITTHYRPWKHKLRWGWLKSGQCQFIELAGWSAQTGLTLVRSIPDVERLRTLLAESPPDAQLVCAKSGVVLEAALDFLTQLYECSVPRRQGGSYTLGDLLPAINKKLRSALQVDVLEIDFSGAATYRSANLAPVLDELQRIANVRNVIGCHFNALAFELHDGDGIAFGRNVLALIDLLADPEAGWPRSAKSGKYWANSGETRRLHPLQQPT